MSQPVAVFVNERVVSVLRGATVRGVVTAFDAALVAGLDQGGVVVTDGVGRPVDLDESVGPGTILRVVRTARATSPGSA